MCVVVTGSTSAVDEPTPPTVYPVLNQLFLSSPQNHVVCKSHTTDSSFLKFIVIFLVKKRLSLSLKNTSLPVIGGPCP